VCRVEAMGLDFVFFIWLDILLVFRRYREENYSTYKCRLLAVFKIEP
jgi:hypothetical protein